MCLLIRLLNWSPQTADTQGQPWIPQWSQLDPSVSRDWEHQLCFLHVHPHRHHSISLLPRQQFYESFPQLHCRLPVQVPSQVHPLLPLHPGVGGHGRLTSIVEFPKSESQSWHWDQDVYDFLQKQQEVLSQPDSLLRLSFTGVYIQLVQFLFVQVLNSNARIHSTYCI